MMITSTEIKDFQNDLEITNEIELDDLESIVTIEFADDLPCDTVVNGF